MMSLRQHHFLDVFDPELSCERLKIPPNFVKHMEAARASGSVSLVGPSGNTWHVELIWCDEGVFFNDGWGAFVNDHFLQTGESLVFRYDGISHFSVQVFDTSACEKEAAFCVRCSQGQSKLDQHVGEKRGRYTGPASLHAVYNGVAKKSTKRRKQVALEQIMTMKDVNVGESGIEQSVSEDLGIKNETGQELLSGGSMEGINFIRDLMLYTPNSCEARPEFPLHNCINTDNAVGSKASDCTPKKMSTSEEKRVAEAFTSPFPRFVKIIKKSNISGTSTLKIPSQFSMDNLPNCKIRIILRNLEGQCWPVNSIPVTKVQTSHTLSGGWMAFVHANGIKLGNICIFELVEKCELRVHILGVEKEGVGCQSGKALSGGSTVGHAAPGFETNRELEKLREMSQQARSDCTAKKGSTCGKGKKKSGTARRNRKRAPANRSSTRLELGTQPEACNSAILDETFTIDELGTHAKTYRLMPSCTEEKVLQSFHSSFPYFVKIMTKFNVSKYTLKMPANFSVQHLPNCKTKISLRTMGGKCWTVNSIPATKTGKSHTFFGGWMAFVLDNDVKVGDACFFELVGTCEMRVRIFRAGKEILENQ